MSLSLIRKMTQKRHVDNTKVLTKLLVLRTLEMHISTITLLLKQCVFSLLNAINLVFVRRDTYGILSHNRSCRRVLCIMKGKIGGAV